MTGREPRRKRRKFGGLALAHVNEVLESDADGRIRDFRMS